MACSLKDTTKTFHVVVEAKGVSNPPSGTSQSFTINGTTLDPYEPNNAFSTAHTVSINDTIHGCMTFDSIPGIPHNNDTDFFKFTLQSGAIINIVTIPEFHCDTGYTYNRSDSRPTVTLFDNSRNDLGFGNNYYASAGTYYCRVFGDEHNLGWGKIWFIYRYFKCSIK